MEMALSNSDTIMLRNFRPLHNLSEMQLSRVAESVEKVEAPPGRLLLKRGSRDNHSFFLVDGQLRLKSGDGKIMDIKAGDPASLDPISRLLPRMYDVVSVTLVRLIRIDNSLLDQVHDTGVDGIDGYSVSGDEELEANTPFENQLSSRMLKDLEQDQLKLPSLPEVAIRLGKALKDDISDATRIAEMIQTDPVITAKLIKAANSALYGRRTPVETCAGAVVRLGADITHKLVLSYVMRELFKSESGLLQQRMQALWKHSTRVAAISYVLARHDSRFNPEHAMLAGLLHDIGVVAVLNYAKGFPMEARQPEVIDQAIQRLRAQTGSMILRNWGFADEFVITALESEEWMRNKGLTPDYCDLVIIAQLHSFVGTTQALSGPAINEVPAHARLALGELTPRMSLRILDEAKEQIAHTEALLNI
jgi:HD-like signal output (HDOD) protein